MPHRARTQPPSREQARSRDVIAGIPVGALLVCEPFRNGARAPAVGAPVARGLRQGRIAPVDVLALELREGTAAEGLREELDAHDLDARLRPVHAVILVADRLSPHTLAGSVTFAVATRARQTGVPAYAVARENDLGSFEARMLDLQLIIAADGARELAAAGRALAAAL
jgi:hypothetical protein